MGAKNASQGYRVIHVGQDWGGKYELRAVGKCIRCKSVTKVRASLDGSGDISADPRGVCGDHASSPLIPSEYDCTGETVEACFLCQNDTSEKYQATLARARVAGNWKPLATATAAQ